MDLDDIFRTFDIPDYCAINYGNNPLFFQKKTHKWNPITSIEYRDISELLAMGMLVSGFKRGENVATIFNSNSPQWNLIDMALAQVGAVNIPIYPTLSDSDFLFILNQAEVRNIFVSDQSLFNKISHLQKEIVTFEKIFSVEKLPNVASWSDLLELGKECDKATVDLFRKDKETIHQDDVVTIIYTSGTTGFPKGAMLTHRNLVTNMRTASKLQPMGKGNRILSLLPLCHLYERTANYQFQVKGCTIYYCDSLKSLSTAFHEVKPHGTTLVPRFLEKTIKNTLVSSKKRNLFVRLFIRWAVWFAYRYKPYRKYKALYMFWHNLAYLFVYKKVRLAMGGRIKYIGCGGAPINHKIERFFWAARMPVYQGYGLSECSPLVSLNFQEKGNYWIGSVGPVIPGVEVKIDSDGEILCRGENVMKGYYKLDDLTCETIVDGWLHTGDTGKFIRDRFLQVTGRKKKMFKTSYGKYIVPQAIENKFSGSKYISHIIVVGEGKHCAAAIISPNYEYFRKEVPSLAKMSDNKLSEHKEVKKIIHNEVEKVNLQLGKTEQIKKTLIVAENWSKESGEISSKRKIRRNIINRRYRKMIQSLFMDESI